MTSKLIADALQDLTVRYRPEKPSVATLRELLLLIHDVALTQQELRALLTPAQRLLVADPLSPEDVLRERRVREWAEKAAADEAARKLRPKPERVVIALALDVECDGSYKLAGDARVETERHIVTALHERPGLVKLFVAPKKV